MATRDVDGLHLYSGSFGKFKIRPYYEARIQLEYEQTGSSPTSPFFCISSSLSLGLLLLPGENATRHSSYSERFADAFCGWEGSCIPRTFAYRCMICVIPGLPNPPHKGCRKLTIIRILIWIEGAAYIPSVSPICTTSVGLSYISYIKDKPLSEFRPSFGRFLAYGRIMLYSNFELRGLSFKRSIRNFTGYYGLRTYVTGNFS